MNTRVALCFSYFALAPQSSHSAPTSSATESLSTTFTGSPAQSTIDSSSTYVGYVGDPNGRGTASLVISCLLTLVLCVWSALHLNVPSQGQTPLQSIFVNARWIVAGVYAPELVVFTAWRQWSSARLLGSLVREMRQLPLDLIHSHITDQNCGSSSRLPHASIPDTSSDENDPSNKGDLGVPKAIGSQTLAVLPSSEVRDRNEASTAKEKKFSKKLNPDDHFDLVELQEKNPFQKRHDWTMAHNFFASTGGFVFEIGDTAAGSLEINTEVPFLPPECPQRLTLTARGMALLARCGHLPDVAKAEITDKSKANDLAKALVMIQASWMLVQVIGRLIAKLPVTLLEVNTIAHVLCAILMYTMWWHKPLNPKEPFVLSGDWVNSLCAYMYMSSEMSGAVDPKSIESQTLVKTLFAFLHLYSRVPELELMSYHRPCQTKGINADEQSKPSQVLEPASEECLSELKEKKLEKAAGTAFFERRPRVKGIELNSSLVSQTCRRRWELAAAAMERYPAIREHHLFHSHYDDQGQCLHFRSEELLVAHVQNWPWDDLLRNVGGLVVGMILWLACFVYGAVHIAAWNDHFPSVAEKWLWRSSSAYIGFCGGLWVVLNYGAQAYRPFNAFWEKWMDGGGRWWQNILISVPVIVCGFSLILARAFIVIEAFVSIRELPAGAYDTPTWTQVFPHF